jgi:hypothetical protein
MCSVFAAAFGAVGFVRWESKASGTRAADRRILAIVNRKQPRSDPRKQAFSVRSFEAGSPRPSIQDADTPKRQAMHRFDDGLFSSELSQMIHRQTSSSRSNISSRNLARSSKYSRNIRDMKSSASSRVLIWSTLPSARNCLTRR